MFQLLNLSTRISLLNNTTNAPVELLDQSKGDVDLSGGNGVPSAHSRKISSSRQVNINDSKVNDFNDLNDELEASVAKKNGNLDHYSQAAGNVVNTIEHTHKLPGNVSVGNTLVNMPGYLDGATKQVLNVSKKHTNTTIKPTNRTKHTGDSEDTVTVKRMSKKEYLTVLTKISKYYNDKKPCS